MKMIPLSALGLLLAAGFHSPEAQAQSRVECRSENYQYRECSVPWKSTALVQQLSKTRCVQDVNWGIHPQLGVMWVSEGCAGVFEAAVRPASSSSSNNTGNTVIGVAAGAAIGAVLMNQYNKDKQRERDERNARNSHSTSTYDGCHGTGCIVDNPDAHAEEEIDTAPQFDENGFPNYDEHGNYVGCHGMGCVTDDPDNDG